jgi:hypothetical protein
MYDGVDPAGSNHFGNNGIANVGTDEIGPTQVVPRRNHVDPDNLGVLLGKRSGESGTQVTRDSSDEDDPFPGHQGLQSGRLLARAAALDPCALEQLAMLLFRHPLAALLDDRTH